MGFRLLLGWQNKKHILKVTWAVGTWNDNFFTIFQHCRKLLIHFGKVFSLFLLANSLPYMHAILHHVFKQHVSSKMWQTLPPHCPHILPSVISILSIMIQLNSIYIHKIYFKKQGHVKTQIYLNDTNIPQIKRRINSLLLTWKLFHFYLRKTLFFMHDNYLR